MNEHYFQKKSRQVTGLIGYILGALLTLFSLVMIPVDFVNWTTYAMMAALGAVVFFLADIILANNAKTDLLLSIMKRQEALFRQAQKPKVSSMPSDPLGFFKSMMGGGGDDDPIAKAIKISMNDEGDMKIDGDEPPAELLDILNKITGALKSSIEKEMDKPFEDMTVDELQELLDKAISKEDYKKATFLRDEIGKRGGGDSDDKKEE